MAKVPNDYELDFLKNCTKEELEPLVGILLGTDEDGCINRGGRISSELEGTPAFKANYPDHTKYVDEIIEEIQKYGGNTIWNIFRDMGVSYHELLCDAAKKMNVNFKKTQKTPMIEGYLLAKVLDDAWEEMAEDDRQKLLKEAGNILGVKGGGLPSTVAIQIFRAGGFKSYQISLIIVNAISKMILGHGLRMAQNALLARILAVCSGPIGWVLTGIWTGIDIAGEAYRVTIPACIYIAALRTMKENEKFAEAATAEVAT